MHKAGEENYFIKSGYRTNLNASSFDHNESNSYWTEERLKASTDFQFYVYRFAKLVFNRRRYKTILDVGCGPATKIKRFFASDLAETTLMDQPSSQDLIRKCVPEAKFIGINLETCRDALVPTHDLVICSDVIEHLRDPNRCLDLIRSTLHRHGTAIISTPERNYRRGTACMKSENSDHVREWNATEFRKYLESQGLEIEQILFLPQQRIHCWEYSLSRLLQGIWRIKRWSSCQVAVCRPGRPGNLLS